VHSLVLEPGRGQVSADLARASRDGPAQVRFDSDVAQDYERGREMTRAELKTWTGALAARMGGTAGSPRTVLDLGSGTGRFSPALAEECDADVIGVEPSTDMRGVAQQVNRHPRVRYVGGRAEGLPLRSRSCDAAFLFLCLHHFTDLGAAAREIGRVVRRGGTVLIRTEFSDRPHLTLWHGFLPRGGEIDRGLYPRVRDVADALNDAAISVEALQMVPYLAAPSLSAYIGRLHLLSLSALRLLGREETEAELSRLSLQEAELSQPVSEVGHLMICRRR
jgi:ubiquinone/menaquinone biosynthesis C-methylase UbiE